MFVFKNEYGQYLEDENNKTIKLNSMIDVVKFCKVNNLDSDFVEKYLWEIKL